MKTTVLKASKELAEDISGDLLSRRSAADRPVFKRTEIENGFEISGQRKDEGEVVVFRFVDEQGRKRFDYDERLLKFC